MIELYILLALMIVGALAAVEMKNLLSAVIAVGVVGLGLSIVFLLLKAPDIALTQLVVEIVAVIILIRATLNMKNADDWLGPRPLGAVMGAVFMALTVWMGIVVFRSLPSFGNPLMLVSQRYLENSAADTGAANVVAAIILDYRAYDTLGEATVLFTAVVGVLTVMRRKGVKSHGDPQ
jgi:multisubunit Na+/H+ antiporter MnhB subunit